MARLYVQSEGISVGPKELKWGVTQIGRGSDNDVIITHPSISYHHCDLELGLDYLIVRDCGSTNGTFVNDQKINEVRLQPGQSLRLGQVGVKLEWSADSIAVPVIKPERPPESVALSDGVMSCRSHVTIPSVWFCGKCTQYYCSSCVRGVNLVGRPVHKLCPLCSSPVELAPWANTKDRKKSLWTRMKRAFSRTIRVR
jgi:hypothetical protein